MLQRIFKRNLRSKVSNFLIWSGIIIGAITIIAALILAIIMYQHPTTSMANPHNLWIVSSIFIGIWDAVSTFTLQSNIILWAFFVFVLINRIYPNRYRFVHGPVSLAVTLYITITMLVFWAVLFKPILAAYNPNNPISTFHMVFTFFLHLVMPVTGIMFYLINAGTSHWAMKPALTKYFPISIGYMFAYLGYVLIKGTFVGTVIVKNGQKVIDYSFPYPFLNYQASLSNFFIYFFVIFIGFLLFYSLYYFYNNYRYKKNQLTNNNQVTLKQTVTNFNEIK